MWHLPSVSQGLGMYIYSETQLPWQLKLGWFWETRPTTCIHVCILVSQKVCSKGIMGFPSMTIQSFEIWMHVWFVNAAPFRIRLPKVLKSCDCLLTRMAHPNHKFVIKTLFGYHDLTIYAAELSFEGKPVCLFLCMTKMFIHLQNAGQQLSQGPKVNQRGRNELSHAACRFSLWFRWSLQYLVNSPSNQEHN